LLRIAEQANFGAKNGKIIIILPAITLPLSHLGADYLEVNLVSKDGKSIVIEFTDVKETLVHPLVDTLLDDKDVLLAAYKTGHPQLDKPILTVRTQRVNPETAVKKAADSLADEILALEKEFEKAVRSSKAKKAKPKKKAEIKKKKAAVPKKKSKKKSK
jgi:DNA-directed RNA polymerase subunit L